MVKTSLEDQSIFALIKRDSKTTVIVFISAFALFYILVLDINPVRAFFIIALMFLAYILYTSKDVKKQIAQTDVERFTSEIEKNMDELKDHEFPTEMSYYIHKAPKNLKYIYQNPDIVQVLYKLRFLIVYDKYALLQLVVLLEHFLKIHYNVILGYYEPVSYFDILKDARRNILNLMQSAHFQLPDVSKVYVSPTDNIEEDMRQSILQLQSLTYQLVKVVHKKYRKQLGIKQYKGPNYFDTSFNDKYHIY